MSFKKILALLLTLMLAFSACLALSSCSDTPEDCTEHIDENGDGVCDREGCGESLEVTPPTDDGEYFNENGELILYRGGVPTFNFIYGTDARSSLSSLLNTFASDLNKINDIKEGGVGIYSDTDKNYTPQAVEILFGTIKNRGDEYILNKYELGYNGYIVKQIGTKIVVLGGSSDALLDAFNYLKTTVFGITRNTPPFVDFVMAADKSCDRSIKKYSITDFKIGDNSLKGYTLVSKTTDKSARAVADKIQETLYKKVGIWLEAKSGTEPIENAKSVVIRTVENDGESDGFTIRCEGDNIFIECMYPLLFEETFSSIYDPLMNKTGKVNVSERTVHLRTIYYEDYADKTGKTNALEGIIECHDYANANGHNVKALRSGDGEFYIGRSGGAYATIKTDTDWTGASFKIDDSILTYEDNWLDIVNHIFCVKGENTRIKYTPDASATEGIGKFLHDINLSGGLDKETFNKNLSFDLGLKRDALVYIFNENHKNYIRYGENANEGNKQQEFIYLRADGTVDPLTPILFDFDEVTKIEVLFVDDEPITIKGGTFTTIANQFRRSVYFKRGIDISRSNTTIEGITHLIEGEGDEGSPYNGFIAIGGTNNVTLKDSVLTGHRAYDLPGSEGVNTMGTYDFAPIDCNNTLVLNVTQTNFLIKDSEGYDVPSVGNGYWGIMGGNDCKNLTYDGCRLTRFDSHRGTVNATIIRSEVALIAVIGGGTLRIEDSKVYMQTKADSKLITLRNDYGSTWCGEVIIKDVTAVLHEKFNKSEFALLEGNIVATHDFGYDCYAPIKVTVDNFKLSSDNTKRIKLAQGSMANEGNVSAVRPYYPTEEFHIYNNAAGYTYDKVYSTTKLFLHDE